MPPPTTIRHDQGREKTQLQGTEAIALSVRAILYRPQNLVEGGLYNEPRQSTGNRSEATQMSANTRRAIEARAGVLCSTPNRR